MHREQGVCTETPRARAYHALAFGEGALPHVTRRARACSHRRSSERRCYLTASAIIAAPGMASEMSITSIRNHPEPCQAAQPPPAFHTR